MTPDDVKRLLEGLAQGETTVEAALKRLSVLPFEDLGFARIDHHRHLRTGAPEVVYGPGKTPEQIAPIVDAMYRAGQTAMVTRLEPEKAAATQALLREAAGVAVYEPVPRLLVAGAPMPEQGRGTIAVVCAGTSDLPVAEEAARTAELLGNRVERYADVGVAGIHRLFAVRERLEAAEVLVVVAGMEGALPSVVKGLVSRPVVGVPTSVGFGANFHGLSALLAMLNSCAPGMTVVNIDNGFGAGYAASLMNRAREQQGG
jgi:NCAIR mutase (PurE)-related protein